MKLQSADYLYLCTRKQFEIMTVEQQISNSVITAIKELYGADIPAEQIQLQKTRKEFSGHLTLVVFPFLRASHQNPELTAQAIGEYLKKNEPAVSDFNVVKGFLNMTVSCATWIDLLNSINSQPDFGITKILPDAPLVMIEYSSPNTNKPLHLGHGLPALLYLSYDMSGTGRTLRHTSKRLLLWLCQVLDCSD